MPQKKKLLKVKHTPSVTNTFWKGIILSRLWWCWWWAIWCKAIYLKIIQLDIFDVKHFIFLFFSNDELICITFYLKIPFYYNMTCCKFAIEEFQWYTWYFILSKTISNKKPSSRDSDNFRNFHYFILYLWETFYSLLFILTVSPFTRESTNILFAL